MKPLTSWLVFAIFMLCCLYGSYGQTKDMVQYKDSTVTIDTTTWVNLAQRIAQIELQQKPLEEKMNMLEVWKRSEQAKWIPGKQDSVLEKTQIQRTIKVKK